MACSVFYANCIFPSRYYQTVSFIIIMIVQSLMSTCNLSAVRFFLQWEFGENLIAHKLFVDILLNSFFHNCTFSHCMQLLLLHTVLKFCL